MTTETPSSRTNFSRRNLFAAAATAAVTAALPLQASAQSTGTPTTPDSYAAVLSELSAIITPYWNGPDLGPDESQVVIDWASVQALQARAKTLALQQGQVPIETQPRRSTNGIGTTPITDPVEDYPVYEVSDLPVVADNFPAVPTTYTPTISDLTYIPDFTLQPTYDPQTYEDNYNDYEDLVAYNVSDSDAVEKEVGAILMDILLSALGLKQLGSLWSSILEAVEAVAPNTWPAIFGAIGSGQFSKLGPLLTRLLEILTGEGFMQALINKIGANAAGKFIGALAGKAAPIIGWAILLINLILAIRRDWSRIKRVVGHMIGSVLDLPNGHPVGALGVA